ncbi:MAG: GNAT family N-acetyltransferase [Bacteroidetes bacterium]|nr:GNAT family N-acetyltransferase [Bacteroidota bacterium]
MEALTDDNLSVLACEARHIDLLVDIANKAYSDNYLHIWDDEGVLYLEKNFSKPVLASELADKNNCFFLVQNREKFVGFAKIVLCKSFGDYTADESLYVQRLYLRKAYCGLGIGAKLMMQFHQKALALHKKVVWLQAMPSTPSVSFYEKLGYTITHKGYIPFPHIKPAYRDLYDMVYKLE